jgi:pyrimidine-specific ribonucleoside hydrolase
MRLNIILSFLLLALTINLDAHPWKPSHYVVIDTDGGADDLKALNMLLASPDVRVLAIIASGGTIDAQNCYIKVRSMLDSFHHEGLPVAISYNVMGVNYQMPLHLKWAESENVIPPATSNFIEIVNRAMEGETSPVKLIALGSLNSAAGMIRAGMSFSEIYWSIGEMGTPDDLNYTLDPESAAFIADCPVPLTRVGYTGEETLYNPGLISALANGNTIYAEKVASLFNTPGEMADHSFIRRGVDDMIPVLLHYPELFVSVSTAEGEWLMPDNSADIAEKIEIILGGETVNRNQVVKQFPADTSFYFPDIQPYIMDIIENHGRDEFVSGILANELHRHLGIFAIVGVKMGVRAREYFHTGVDEMKVISMAASTPPLSCMNDGLQVSTGATPGHGLLEIRDNNPIPVAEFRYKKRVIRIELKKDLAAEMSGQLREINYIYGLDSNIYWELVRQKAILYWKNLDRHEIFDITEL